ncbi:gamma-butyrolactone biosynthesis protein [Streptomyces actuosus]|uniref:Gamma-butyrolactone biosynthesis protein n=1 Tax=Streptomyces actuosus TaxID=1885 RepID=A0ABS2VMR8_STRAS|nr:AfsA-related hotdog domain-containing protein [Streptomyces actuosus]MBN0044359.1 gamma-butyrolactone biosynthesis protein [Streptomyces actuosus]
MSTNAFAPQVRELEFFRSVDRRLLHRRALSEVFLTDTSAVDGSRFLAGAQLPSSHACFTDHPGRTVIDPVLLLECARQAETYGAHAHLGVDSGTKFVLQSWEMRLPGLFAAHAGAPGELTMEVTTDRPADATAPARSVTYDVRFLLDGTELGEVRMAVGYLSPATYSALRTRRRGTPPVSSDDVPVVAATVAAHEVGRALGVNALLLDPVVDGGGVTAGVRTPNDNPSMFDHAQDHLPGMVLTEAARQAALLAGARLLDRPVDGTALVGFDLGFSRFAELDAPVTVSAVPEPGGDGVRAVRVVFRQGGEEIASGTVDTAPVPASHRSAR